MTRQINAGGVRIGGGAPVSIQSMLNTATTDVEGSLAQIAALKAAGCELARLAVPDQAAADALFQEVLGTTPALLRPPYGSMNKTLKTTSGRSIVTWSIDTEDWRSKDADKVVTGVENAGNLDGQVILLHSIYESTVAATEVLVPWLLEQGYQLVTVSELIQLRFGDEVEPNRTYNYDYFRFQVPPLPAETVPAAA